MPDGDHGMIVQWLTRICMQHRPELWHPEPAGITLPTQPLKNWVR